MRGLPSYTFGIGNVVVYGSTICVGPFYHILDSVILGGHLKCYFHKPYIEDRGNIAFNMITILYEPNHNSKYIHLNARLTIFPIPVHFILFSTLACFRKKRAVSLM